MKKQPAPTSDIEIPLLFNEPYSEVQEKLSEFEQFHRYFKECVYDRDSEYLYKNITKRTINNDANIYDFLKADLCIHEKAFDIETRYEMATDKWLFDYIKMSSGKSKNLKKLFDIIKSLLK